MSIDLNLAVYFCKREIGVVWQRFSYWGFNRDPAHNLFGSFYEGYDRPATGWSLHLGHLDIRYWNKSKMNLVGPHN